MKVHAEQYVPAGYEQTSAPQNDSQPGLFDHVPIAHSINPSTFHRALARHTDPGTSHHAIESLRRSGRRESANHIVLDFLRASSQSFTYREIALRLGTVEAVEVMRRLNDLRRGGHVEKCGERICSTNGHRMAVWRSTGS